jgi:hypothetical protein
MNAPLVRKIAVVLALLLAAVAFDRLTRLPTAGPIGEDKRGRPAESGQALTLSGASSANLLDFQTGAGEGVQVVARGAPLKVDGSGAASSLSWQVSRPGGDTPGDDNKVDVQLTRVAAGDRPTLILAWAGENPVQPVLSVRVADAPVRVAGHVLFGDLRRLPPTALTLGGTVVPGPAIATGFVVPVGGELRLAFPAFPGETQKGLTIGVGGGDLFTANRLPVRAVSVAELSGAGGEGRPLFVACAAAEGRILWRTLWSGGRPAGRDCANDTALAITELDISKGQIKTELAGSAYVTTDQPTVSRWWTWAQGNLVASGLFGLCVAGLLAWARREFLAPKPAPSPAAPASPP